MCLAGLEEEHSATGVEGAIYETHSLLYYISFSVWEKLGPGLNVAAKSVLCTRFDLDGKIFIFVSSVEFGRSHPIFFFCANNW